MFVHMSAIVGGGGLQLFARWNHATSQVPAVNEHNAFRLEGMAQRLDASR